ncbi:MAG: DUF3422 domain-containing protein [Synechococcaceae cyanobacterium SM2_3_2]|nr:DUF3422 domain-containing protein [Synechococcaceae cyanobacterium SM2_3_2]
MNSSPPPRSTVKLPQGSGLVIKLVLGSGLLSVALKAGENVLSVPATLPLVLTLIALPTVVVGTILGIRQIRSGKIATEKPPDGSEGLQSKEDLS